MRKYLIVSLSTGGGHATVGNALADRLREQGDEVLVVDLFKEINSMGLHTFICEGYNLVATKAPGLYEGIYQAGNRPLISKSSFDMARRLSQKKIRDLLDTFAPEVIIAVHPIATDILGGMKQKGRIKSQKIISVITDYLAHFVYAHKHRYIDAYLVGGEVTRQDLLSRGVEASKIHAYGIPIRQEFYLPQQKVKNEDFTILVMGGSMGSRNMTAVIRRLLKVEAPLKIIAVCGRDEELKERMDKLVGKVPGKEIIVYGFTDQVHILMDQSDLLISKPGGASVTEALLRRVPMIIPYMLGGQEKENRDYLVDEKAAIWVGRLGDITPTVERLMNHPEELSEMVDKMVELSAHFSVEKALSAIRNL